MPLQRGQQNAIFLLAVSLWVDLKIPLGARSHISLLSGGD